MAHGVFALLGVGPVMDGMGVEVAVAGVDFKGVQAGENPKGVGQDAGGVPAEKNVEFSQHSEAALAVMRGEEQGVGRGGLCG
tara:strand:- start:202 stop:447 length:246 start_codon:yes stop_codon:yes gene_type:complete